MDLFFKRGRHWQSQRLEGPVQRRPRSPDFEGLRIRASPDGQYVYFSRNLWLWRVRTDGTDEQQVEGMPQLCGYEAWTPFGSGIYFLGCSDGKSAIDFFDLRTREIRPVYFVEKPAPNWLGGLPASSDGKWLFLPLVEDSSSDIMPVENWR